jgi:hypothetical protein
LAEYFTVFGKIIYDLDKREIIFDSPKAFFINKKDFFGDKFFNNTFKSVLLALAIIPLASLLFYLYYEESKESKKRK